MEKENTLRRAQGKALGCSSSLPTQITRQNAERLGRSKLLKQLRKAVSFTLHAFAVVFVKLERREQRNIDMLRGGDRVNLIDRSPAIAFALFVRLGRSRP